MSDKFIMSTRQAAELDHALERNGYTPAHVKKMSSGSILTDFRKVLDGHAIITVPEHLIDCDADPFVPNRWSLDGWSVEEHRKGGMFQWDPTKVKLWLAKGQRGGGSMVGLSLRTELAEKPVMNANVLDYLLANPHLIPDGWNIVFFWGTIYRIHCADSLCVRYLCKIDGRWIWRVRRLDRLWDINDNAALSS